MKKHALIISLLLCAAAAAAQAPSASDCGATPAADACAAKPKNTDIFGIPLPSANASPTPEKGVPEVKLPILIDDTGNTGKAGPGTKDPAASSVTAGQAEVTSAGGKGPADLSFLERASTSLHLWLGLALALLAAAEAFAADNPGRRTVSLAGCALAAALALGSIAAAYFELGHGARELLAFRPGFLLYFGAALLLASGALSQMLSRFSAEGTRFWGGASAFFLAAAGAVLLAVQARVNPEASAVVMAGHVPIGAALLAAGAARVFLLFSPSRPARAALPVFLFIAAAMAGMYRESPDAFSLHFSTVSDADGEPAASGPEKAATGRANEEAADKKGPRG